MALIKCGECGNQISKSAESCPSCGAPNKSKRKETGCGTVILAVILAFGVLAYLSMGTYNEYDKKAKTAKINTVLEREVDLPKWTSWESKNELDDSTSVYLTLDADQGKSKWGKKVRLTARCKSNTTELYITWHDYLGDDSYDVYKDFKYVTYRLGDEPAKKDAKWDLSTDKNATFAPNAIPLLRQIARVEKAVFQTVPYNENPIMAIFDTTGLEEPIQKIAKTCHWTLAQ